MTVVQHDAQYWSQQRQEWLDRVERLLKQIDRWARSQGWPVSRETRLITEKHVGTYEAPALGITLPGGELHAQPIALEILGRGDGRVDLEGYPTLNRVMLIWRAEGWEIITDSGVPLHASWNKRTFVRLAQELVA